MSRFAPVHRVCLAVVALAVSLGPAWAAEPDPLDTAAQIDARLADELGHASQTPLADDSVYLRRVTLDLIGELPTPEAVTLFMLDPDADKRAKVVETLLAQPHYGQNWARYWRDVILARRAEERALIVSNPLVVYLTQQFNENTSWDRIARGFITAAGDVRERGETAIIVSQDGEPEDITAEVSRLFLGIQIQCAQCHDHLTDRWKREQFHELAAFFPRTSMRPMVDEKRRTFVVAAITPKIPAGRKLPKNRRQSGEHFMPDLQNPQSKGTLMKPVFFLSGDALELGASDAERRESVARWITADPWFAKAVVNRLWAELVGEGFFEPIDDIGPDRTATAPETLEYLSSMFIESGYDLKWLFRTITATRVYQQQGRSRRDSSEAAFAANCQQRLRGDQLFNVLTHTFEIEEQFPRQQAFRLGPTASPRYDLATEFFYDPSLARDEATGSIPQALWMMNSTLVTRHINGADRSTMLGRLLDSIRSDETLIVELYLRTLAREPSDRELHVSLSHVRSVSDRAEAYEDLLWALINSTEFLHRR